MLGDRGTRRNTARSAARASIGNFLLGLRIWPTELRDLAAHPFRDTHAVQGWDMTPAPPFGIRVAGDSTVAPVFRPSCSPVSHYGIGLWECKRFIGALTGSCDASSAKTSF